MNNKTFYFLLTIILTIMVLLIVMAPAGAQTKVTKAIKAVTQEWTTASQFTFAWDVPTLVDGSAVPAGDTIKYQPYIKPEGGAAVAYGPEITATSVTATLTAEGRYRGCAQAIRVPAGSNERIVSGISCSDVAEVCQNSSVWGVVYYIMINDPSGLRRNQ